MKARQTAEKQAVLVTVARKHVGDARIRPSGERCENLTCSGAQCRRRSPRAGLGHLEAERARVDSVEAETLERSLEGVRPTDSGNLRIAQAALRQQNSARLSEFSDTFARIARAILGSDVLGTIRFRGRYLQPWA